MDYQITLGDIETGSNLISPLSSALGRLIFMAKGFKLFKWLSDSRASERARKIKMNFSSLFGTSLCEMSQEWNW